MNEHLNNVLMLLTNVVAKLIQINFPVCPCVNKPVFYSLSMKSSQLRLLQQLGIDNQPPKRSSLNDAPTSTSVSLSLHPHADNFSPSELL